MHKLLSRLLPLLFISSFLFGTANVSGKFTNPNPSDTSVFQNAEAHLDLHNCGGNYPVVTGASVGQHQVYTLSTVDGTWSGTLYRNDEISCNGSFTTWWTLTYWINGRQVGPSRDFLVDQASFNFDSSTPITVYPPPVPPTPPLISLQPKVCPFTSATTWTCVHNFGVQPVVAQLYDSNWHEIMSDTPPTATDVNTETAVFLQPQSGYMIVLYAGNSILSTANPNYFLLNPNSDQSMIGDHALTLGGSLSAKRILGCSTVYNGGPFANIQAAVTDAGTTGCVVIESNYAGVDTYTNANSVPVIDLRSLAVTFGTNPNIDASWSLSSARVGLTSATVNTNSFGFTSHLLMSPSGSTTNFQRVAIFGWCKHNDTTATSPNRDCVGVQGYGTIQAGNTNGRAWGGVSVASNDATTSDGQLIGHEIDVQNNSTTPTPNNFPDDVGVHNAKVGLWLFTFGSNTNAASWMIANGNGGVGAPPFLNGIAVRNIASGGIALLVPNNRPVSAYNVSSVAKSVWYLDTGNPTSGVTIADDTNMAINLGTATHQSNTLVNGQLFVQPSALIANSDGQPVSFSVRDNSNTSRSCTLQAGHLTAGANLNINCPAGDIAFIGNGIAGDGGAYKHKRITTGSISATTRTEVLLTWGTTFPDANYTVTCSVEDSTTAAGTQGLTYERIRTHSATQVGAVINNPTAGAITGTLDCVGVHD